MEVEMEGMEAIDVPMILVLFNPLGHFQEMLTLLCLIVIAEEVKSMKKRQLHILIVALERPKIKQAKLRLIMTTRSCIGVQMNNKCLPLLQRLLTAIGHVVLTSDSYDGGPYNYGYNQTNADWGTSSDQSYPSYPGSEPHFTQSNPSTQIMTIFKFSTT